MILTMGTSKLRIEKGRTIRFNWTYRLGFFGHTCEREAVITNLSDSGRVQVSFGDWVDPQDIIDVYD